VNNYGSSPYSPERLGVRPATQLSSRFLTDAFIWMFGALLVSAFVAWMVARNEDFVYGIADLGWILFIGQLGLGLGIQMGINRLPATLALGLFFVYSAMMGLTLGVLVWAYSGAAVYQAFFSAAAAFGGAAIYGIVTKRSLANIGGYLFMGAWGIFFALLINALIFRSSTMDLILCVAGVLIFTALTAWTTQKIANGEFAAMTGSMEKASVYGAILLYIEFVNIFVMLLRIFGGRR
jgi:FtsH-binding integral membrane protein